MDGGRLVAGVKREGGHRRHLRHGHTIHVRGPKILRNPIREFGEEWGVEELAETGVSAGYR